MEQACVSAVNLPSVLTDVSEIQYEICTYQQCVEEIKPNNYIIAVQQLMDNPKSISKDNQGHKERTFAYHDSRFDGFGDRYRPADRKTYKEQDFPDAEMIHKKSD